MNRPRTASWVAGIALVLLAGLGLGFGIKHLRRVDSPAPRDPSSSASHRMADGSSDPDPEPEPIQEATTSDKRALLVGVTKYDHLPEYQLTGPANDVRLMRRLLQERYLFPADAIVS